MINAASENKLKLEVRVYFFGMGITNRLNSVPILSLFFGE